MLVKYTKGNCGKKKSLAKSFENCVTEMQKKKALKSLHKAVMKCSDKPGKLSGQMCKFVATQDPWIIGESKCLELADKCRHKHMPIAR